MIDLFGNTKKSRPIHYIVFIELYTAHSALGQCSALAEFALKEEKNVFFFSCEFIKRIIGHLVQ